MAEEWTMIRVLVKTRTALHAMCGKDETYDRIIQKLMGDSKREIQTTNSATSSAGASSRQKSGY